MASKDISKAVVKDIPADVRQTALPGTDAPPAELRPPAVALDTDAKRKLGDTFLADLKVKEDAENALDAARTKASVSATAIVEAAGHKGPFSIGGRQFTASKGKGSQTYVMREVSGIKDTF